MHQELKTNEEKKTERMKIYRGNIKLCQGTTVRNERIKKENPKSNCINVNEMS